MRYSQLDYDRTVALLFNRPGEAANLAPSERRALDQLRIAYTMQADVPLTDLKLARAILEATDTARAANQPQGE